MFGGVAGGMRHASNFSLLGITSDGDGLPIVPPRAIETMVIGRPDRMDALSRGSGEDLARANREIFVGQSDAMALLLQPLLVFPESIPLRSKILADGGRRGAAQNRSLLDEPAGREVGA